MPSLNATPDLFDFTPSLVLMLRDGFTGANVLAGDVTVKIGASSPLAQNPPKSTFVFLRLANGSYLVMVRSTPDEPYYLPADIRVTLPFARPANTLWPQPPVWTGYPDLVLADPSKSLDDPGQTAAYLAQREQTTLLPTASYPFPAGATLLRGVVTGAGLPLAGALVTNDLLAQAGQFAVTVVNPIGPASAPVNLTVVSTPVIESLAPASVLAGSAAFTLGIAGSGFDDGAVAKLSGAALPSSVLSGGFVSAQFTAAQVAAAESYPITVTNASGAVTNQQTLIVVAGPTIGSIDPAVVAAGSAALTLTVRGNGFGANSVVEINTVPAATQFVDSTTLLAAVSAANVATAGQLTVVAAGVGQTSNAQTLNVVNTPVIHSIEPATTIAGAAAFPVTVQGTGFAAGATASVNGTAATTTYVSKTQAVVQITAAQIASPGQLQIVVTNPPSTASNIATLAVGAAPVISSIDPATVTAESAAFTIDVQGSGFLPGAVVQLNGSALQTTVICSKELHALAPRSGYTTGVDGTFVLFFDDVQGRSRVETLIVTHPSYPNPKVLDVTVLRGATVSVDIDMSS